MKMKIGTQVFFAADVFTKQHLDYLSKEEAISIFIEKYLPNKSTIAFSDIANWKNAPVQ
jgi:hypothetical protein